MTNNQQLNIQRKNNWIMVRTNIKTLLEGPGCSYTVRENAGKINSADKSDFIFIGTDIGQNLLIESILIATIGTPQWITCDQRGNSSNYTCEQGRVGKIQQANLFISALFSNMQSWNQNYVINLEISNSGTILGCVL